MHLSRLTVIVFACASFGLAGLAHAGEDYAGDMQQLAPPTTIRAKLQDFTSRASELAVRAMSLIGIHYKYGGNLPETGLDCSGLVRYLFKDVWNKDLPRTSEELSHVGQQVDTKDLQPGDLVFFNTLRRSFSHVGIYLGDNKFIHAPSAGGSVRVESMDIGYWRSRFNGARRINAADQQQ
jgi:cell wall-associated NlpC family hydrolase